MADKQIYAKKLMSVSLVPGASTSGLGQGMEGEIPKGYGTAYFSAPNALRRQEIRNEGESLYPGDEENQLKYRCAKFWSEVQLDRVEMVQSDSKL